MTMMHFSYQNMPCHASAFAGAFSASHSASSLNMLCMDAIILASIIICISLITLSAPAIRLALFVLVLLVAILVVLIPGEMSKAKQHS